MQPPRVVGASRFGAPRGYTFATAVASDGRGGAFIALDTDAALEGEPQGVRELALARVDETGRTRWIRQVGAPELFTRAFALAVDGAGNMYAAGLANGRGALAGEPLPPVYTASALTEQ